MLAGERSTGGGEKVVDEDEGDGEDETRALAPAPRGNSQGHTDKHENETGSGVGETLLEFDFVNAAVSAMGPRQQLVVAHRKDGRVAAAQSDILLGAGLERQVGLPESGNGVLVGLIGDDLAFGAVAQPHGDARVWTVDYGGAVGGGDFGRVWVGHIGQEDAAPVGRA